MPTQQEGKHFLVNKIKYFIDSGASIYTLYSNMKRSIVTFENIVAAAHRIRGHIQTTPCHYSERLTLMAGAGTRVYMKKDNMQHTGSYKERGSLNKLKLLTPEEKQVGVMTASAGNHAQGLAYHAGRLGIKSTIFMAHGTPNIKVARTKFYGGQVVMAGFNYDEAFEACSKAVAENGSVMIPPFDDEAVIAGQGTMGLEILEQVPNVDVIVVPIGGGGLISGISIAAKAINPNIRIVGVEPTKIPTMAIACANNGVIEPHEAVTTIADGINVRNVGTLTTEICRTHVDEFVSVSDEEICRAILFLLEGEKTVAEGAGAVCVAALMSGKISGLEGKKVVTVISGGNIDVNVVSQVIECGLMDSHRRVKLSVEGIADRPGSLAKLVTVTSDMAANM